MSFWKELIQHRHDFLREAGQASVGVIEGLVRIHRRDQPHERPVGTLTRERIPEVVPFQLPGVGQHPVALRFPRRIIISGPSLQTAESQYKT